MTLGTLRAIEEALEGLLFSEGEIDMEGGHTAGVSIDPRERATLKLCPLWLLGQ